MMTDVMTSAEYADAVNGYLEAAGWLVLWDEREDDEANARGCDTDARGGPFADEAREHAADAVAQLVGALGESYDVREYLEVRGADMIGHDLWLTRNRHGAGFWDRGLGALGDRLSDAARLLGEATSYVDASGTVRIDA